MWARSWALGDVVDAERRLKLRELEELVEHHLGVGLALDVDHDVDLAAGRRVGDVGDALDLLLLGELDYGLDELALEHAVWYLGDDYHVVVAFGLDLGLGADHDAAAARLVGVADALQAEDLAARGEVGGLDIFHEAVDRQLRIVDQGYRGVEGLGEVVGRHVGGHADGDAGRPVDQKVRDAGRKHRGLEQRVVEVRHEVNRLLVEVAQQLLSHLGELDLGVTHGGGRVTVDRAEVALSEHQRVAQRPLLGHADHGEIDRRVSVGMVLTHHLTDDSGRFLGVS